MKNLTIPLYRFSFLSLIGFSLLQTACNKNLDQYTQTSLTDPVFWKTESDLIGATNYLYFSLPDFDTPSEDLMSDLAVNVTSQTVNSVSDGSRAIPANDDRWNNAYKFIAAANNILEKSVGIPDGEAKTFCLAQTRFFRALNYFNLLKIYGDVPYIGRTIAGRDDQLLYTARTDRRLVVDSIYSDLDFAAANCPQIDQFPGSSQSAGSLGKEYGRISRSAALALKSRVALYEGSWEKYHGEPELTGPKDPNKHFSIAKQTAKTIMDEGKHNLYTAAGALSYQDLFRYPGEYYGSNKENILVRLYGQNIANNISSHGYLRGGLADGGNAATRAYVNIALYADGLPVGKSKMDSTGRETGLMTDIRNRDPRLTMTLFKTGDPYANVNGPMLYGNTFYYHQQKYWTGATDFSSAQVFLDYKCIRYAEVLLNYAEASYELNNGISDDDLNLSINLLRRRATNNDDSKLPPLTNAFVTANTLNMRDEIRRERSVELAFEGFRYWDIIRWKIAEDVLPNPILERKYFSNVNYGGSVVPPLLDGYVLFQAASKRKFDKSKDYLWPLPSAQIGLSNNTLTQNPNWK